MPAPFAPALSPFPAATPFAPPVVAPGTSVVAPFIRPGLPATPPITPPFVPPPPAIAPLTVAPSAAPAVGGVLRTGGAGLAVVGAGLLGLGVGNAIYEDALGRPFGPSLGDLYFPQGQPEPLPVPVPVPIGDPEGQCETLYSIDFLYTAFFNGNAVSRSGNVGNLQGPVSKAMARFPAAGGFQVFMMVNGAERQLGGAGGAAASWQPGSFERNIITREDGLPDDCGETSPEPLREPQSQPQPRPNRPVQPRPIPNPLPQPQREPFRPVPPLLVPPTEQPGRPTPISPPPLFPPLSPLIPALPGPVNRPFPAPQPFPNPLPERQPTPIAPTPRTPPLECCPSVELKLDKLIEINSENECDLTGVEELLTQVLERLKGTGDGNIDITICESDEPAFVTYGGEGLRGIYSAISAISLSLSRIHLNTNCPQDEAIAAVPDWWQVRKGASTPQLSIVLRKQGTKNYHALNIPHPNISPAPTESPITPYVAGNWQAMVYLKDNSKFIVNARTKTEAIRVATQAASIVKADMLPSPLEIATTERRGFAVNQSAMVPRYMDYFSEGQKSRRADWRVRLDE